MAKPLVIIAEPDVSYLAPLEVKLAEGFRDMADMEVISDMEYFRSYFILPRAIDILMIDETIYSEHLGMHSIDKIYVLTESPPEDRKGEDAPPEVVYIYKYTSVNTVVEMMVHTVVSKREEPKKSEENGTKIVAVISPQGGAGATTIALGVGAVLNQKRKKVFYISFQMYQSFHYYLKNRTILPMEVCLQLQAENPQLYEEMMPYFVKEGLVYFPPLKTSRESLGIEISAYINLVSRVCHTNDYDYIVVDIGSELSASTLAFLECAWKVYVVVRQDFFSAFKADVFRRGIDCGDREKYFFVCNCYERDEENALLVQTGRECGSEGYYYVERQTNMPRHIDGLAAVEGIQKLGMLLM